MRALDDRTLERGQGDASGGRLNEPTAPQTIIVRWLMRTGLGIFVLRELLGEG